MKTIKELDLEMDEFFKGRKGCYVTHPTNGAVALIEAGDRKSEVRSVRIFSQTSFDGSYGVCFGVYSQLPTRITSRVLGQHFKSVAEAYEYITGVADKINTFFKSLG